MERCPDVLVVGSVSAGREDPSDLDLVVPPTVPAVARLIEALLELGAWWPPTGSVPRPRDVLQAGFARCTTADGPVDLLVREPW